MALEGFHVLVGLSLPLLGLCSPCHGNTSLVFGIGNGGCHMVSFAETSMDAVTLLAWIKVKCCQSCGHVALIEFGGNVSVDDGADASSSITLRT